MTKAEKQHKEKLAEMACVICERIYGQHPGGNVTLHHLRTGGWGKGGYETLIPLCHHHHQGEEGIHTMGTKAWERGSGLPSFSEYWRTDSHDGGARHLPRNCEYPY